MSAGTSHRLANKPATLPPGHRRGPGGGVVDLVPGAARNYITGAGLSRAAGAAGLPMFPAGVVPVAAKVRRLDGNNDQVAGAGPDVLAAAGAPVGLAGL